MKKLPPINQENGENMSLHTYPYLTFPKRQNKPRTVGRTLVQDKGATLTEIEAIFETVGAYIDYYKPSSMYHAVYPEEFTFRKIDMAKEHNIKPFMGGNVAELAYAQGTLEEHLAYTKAHGWEATEISETYITFPEDLKLDLIKRCSDDGLEVFYEWGLKKPSEPLIPEEAAEDICRYLEAGVSVAILEEGEVDLLIGKDGEGEYPDRLKKLFELVGAEKLMVETNVPKQIGWFMREMGTTINIGNLKYDQVAEIEPLRCGIGREVDYAIYDPYLPDD
jgi:phosphosulfolactate synthase